MISSKNSSILVDGGMPGTYGEIKQKISESRLDAVFVSHVDFDHIGGIVKLISDDEVDLTDCTFYMNHPDLIPYDDSGLVAYHHGDTLRKLTESRNLKLEPVFEDKIMTVGDFSIKVLSPNIDDVHELHKNWNASRIIDDEKLTYKERQVNNGDIINRSSISKLVKCQGISILMLADSHPDIVVKYLKSEGYSNNNLLTLNLMKLSHHGSQHNTSKELLEILDCTNYYISTNGASYDHPDAETIILLQNQAMKIDKIYNIYLNYPITEDVISKCEIPLCNLKFIFQKEVIFCL